MAVRIHSTRHITIMRHVYTLEFYTRLNFSQAYLCDSATGFFLPNFLKFNCVRKETKPQ